MAERLCLFLPTFPCDLVRRRWRLDPGLPVVLSVPDQQRELVGACCGNAAKCGVEAGMTLAHARALLKRAHVEPLDHAATQRSLRRLAVRLLKAVPTVALDGTGGLWLDATGCGRMYGGIERLVPRIHGRLIRLGFAARVVAGPSWGAAWALARYGDAETTVVPASRIEATLGPLPIAALRIEHEVIRRLALVGVSRIEHVLAIPRASIADRYGPELLLRLDQALGRAPEPIRPIRPLEPIAAERLFDGPTDRLADIQLCIERLLTRIAASLTRRELGCRRLAVTLYRSDMPPLLLCAVMSRPSRSGKHFWKLIEPQTERAQLGFGVMGVGVRADGLARVKHEQQSAWARDPAAQTDEDMASLVDTLAARLGPGRVCRLAAVDSHWPERSFAFESATQIGERPAQELPLADADRPSRLLTRPQPIAVTLLLPDGPIAAVRANEFTRRITLSIGPERIEPEWWRDGGAARDYFKVQTDCGAWLWIFRESTNGSWFLHGEWA